MNSLRDGSTYRILYMEDDSNDFLLAEMNLKQLSFPHSLIQIKDEASLELELSEKTVDLIISDSSLPQFDTEKALLYVREHHPRIPFLFFTGQRSPIIRENVLANGAVAFIDKAHPEILITTVELLHASGL